MTKQKKEKPWKGTKKFQVMGIDFRFKGVTHRENSEIELTHEEYEAEQDRVTLTEVEGG